MAWLFQTKTSPTYTFTPSSTDSVSIHATLTDTLGSTSSPSNTVTVSVNQLAITVTPPTYGSIVSGNGTSVKYNDNVIFSVTPNIGYHIASIIIDGNSVTVTNPAAQQVNFINVQTNHTIAATFAVNTYTVTVTQSSNGQITPATTIINYGRSQTFSITANPGYYTADVRINGSSIGPISSYTFTNVQAAYTITATFAPISSPTPTPTPTPTTIHRHPHQPQLQPQRLRHHPLQRQHLHQPQPHANPNANTNTDTYTNSHTNALTQSHSVTHTNRYSNPYSDTNTFTQPQPFTNTKPNRQPHQLTSPKLRLRQPPRLPQPQFQRQLLIQLHHLNQVQHLNLLLLRLQHLHQPQSPQQLLCPQR